MFLEYDLLIGNLWKYNDIYIYILKGFVLPYMSIPSISKYV